MMIIVFDILKIICLLNKFFIYISKLKMKQIRHFKINY